MKESHSFIYNHGFYPIDLKNILPLFSTGSMRSLMKLKPICLGRALFIVPVILCTYCIF